MFKPDLSDDAYVIAAWWARLDYLRGQSQSFIDALVEDWEDSDEDLRLQVFGPHFDEAVLTDCIDLYDAAKAMELGYYL